MTEFIATVRFAFTISAFEDGATALRRLQEAAVAVGFEMRDAAITPASHARPAGAPTGFAALGSDADR